jgi:hypothetical protein
MAASAKARTHRSAGYLCSQISEITNRPAMHMSSPVAITRARRYWRSKASRGISLIMKYLFLVLSHGVNVSLVSLCGFM